MRRNNSQYNVNTNNQYYNNSYSNNNYYDNQYTNYNGQYGYYNYPVINNQSYSYYANNNQYNRQPNNNYNKSPIKKITVSGLPDKFSSDTSYKRNIQITENPKQESAIIITKTEDMEVSVITEDVKVPVIIEDVKVPITTKEDKKDREARREARRKEKKRLVKKQTKEIINKYNNMSLTEYRKKYGNYEKNYYNSMEDIRRDYPSRTRTNFPLYIEYLKTKKNIYINLLDRSEKYEFIEKDETFKAKNSNIKITEKENEVISSIKDSYSNFINSRNESIEYYEPPFLDLDAILRKEPSYLVKYININIDTFIILLKYYRITHYNIHEIIDLFSTKDVTIKLCIRSPSFRLGTFSYLYIEIISKDTDDIITSLNNNMVKIKDDVFYLYLDSIHRLKCIKLLNFLNIDYNRFISEKSDLCFNDIKEKLKELHKTKYLYSDRDD